ncbi:MAG: hypothetical protein ACE5FA_00270 [Dehalococcoidia bacterium]
MPVRWPVDESNRWACYNLPPDYGDLSPQGQRKARINAIELHETPDDVVRGWSLFRDHHLADTEARFYKRRLPSPPVHYRWIHDSAAMTRNIFAAPRGFAKSVVMGTEWPLYLALSRPGIEVLTVTLEGKKARKRGQKWMHQIVQNERIAEDFGDLRGRHRVEGRLWGVELMQLGNGSVLQTTSLGSRNLGERPDIVIWDDIDPDPQIFKGNIDQVVEDAITALFDVFLPMLDGVGTAMGIIGTLLHRRSFLYWAMTTKDPRLGFWNRVLVSIYDREGKPTWKAKFPVRVIQGLKKKIGDGPFAAAYLNDPRSGGDVILRRHARRTGYDVTKLDDAWLKDPLNSGAELTHYVGENLKAPEHDASWRPVTRPLQEMAQEMVFFVLSDYAEERHSRADYSAIAVIGIDRDDNWWVLEMWAGRGTPDELASKIWEYAARWRVVLIGVEAIGPYQALARRVMETRSDFEKNEGWVPFVRQVKYAAHLSKATRIAGLQWRFDEGRIKLPNNPLLEVRSWRMLFAQIDGFTMDMGNLRYDDCIDTVAMMAHAAGPRFTQQDKPKKRSEKSKTFAEMLIDGRRFDPVTGTPYITSMKPSEIPAGALLRQRAAGIQEALDQERPPYPTLDALERLPQTFTLEELLDAVEREHGDDDLDLGGPSHPTG